MIYDIELALMKGKIEGAKKLLQEYFEKEDYSNWLSSKQSEYDSLFKTKEVILSAITDNDEVIEEQITYEYIDDCISFDDWLNEASISQEATYDEEGNQLTEEVTQLVRPYVKPDITGLIDNYIASKYTELRKNEYPEIGEQLDMLYKDMTNGTNNWLETIRQIKEKYPKVEV